MRFNDEDGEVHEVRVADASDGLRGEPAQRYRVHVHVREMWLHDEENVEAAADAMKRPLSTLRSARRGTSLQLRVGDRLDELAGSVPGAQRRNTILKPVVTEPSICTVRNRARRNANDR